MKVAIAAFNKQCLTLHVSFQFHSKRIVTARNQITLYTIFLIHLAMTTTFITFNANAVFGKNHVRRTKESKSW